MLQDLDHKSSEVIEFDKSSSPTRVLTTHTMLSILLYTTQVKSERN